jgi:hypothetical protein
MTSNKLMARGKVALIGADLERTLEMVLKTRLQLDEKHWWDKKLRPTVIAQGVT